jgi:hypothetical protein
MALKRVWPIPFAVMAGGFVAYWFWLRPVQAGANLPEITASVSRGLHETPFSLELAIAPEGAVIRYTLDGTEPTLRNGALYSAPLRISKTTLLRAAAFKERARVSAVTYAQLPFSRSNPASAEGASRVSVRTARLERNAFSLSNGQRRGE